MPRTRYEPPALVTEVLDDWAADQETQSLQPRSIEERRQAVIRYVRFSGEEDPRAFTVRMLKRWIGRPNLSQASKWTYGQHMRAFHAWLVKTHQRDDNPMDEVTIPKKPVSDPRPVETYQLADLLRVVEGSKGPVRMMVLLAAFAGLRVHEIAKVRGEDFDRTTGTLDVEGKGGKKALIDLHPVILAETATYPAAGYWFPNGRRDERGRPEPITRHHVSALIREALDAAHVRATPHALRHTFATALLEKGVDIRMVQELMRHSSLTSTQIYTKVSRVRRAEAVKLLDVPTAGD